MLGEMNMRSRIASMEMRSLRGSEFRMRGDRLDWERAIDGWGKLNGRSLMSRVGDRVDAKKAIDGLKTGGAIG